MQKILLKGITVVWAISLLSACQSSSSSGQSKMSQLSDQAVCNTSTELSATGGATWTSSNLKHVSEAQKRGFNPESCARQMVGKVVSANSSGLTQDEFSGLSDTDICDASVKFDENGNASWDERFSKHIVEAERRNVSLEKCSELTK